MNPTRGTTSVSLLIALALTGLNLLVGTQAGAAPINGGPCQVLQPDGRGFEVRAWGDEFRRILESPDGYTVVRDTDSGQYCYAVRDAGSGTLVSTSIPLGSPRRVELALEKHLRPDTKVTRAEALAAKRAAEEAAPRTKEYYPPSPACPDAVEGLCVLIDFSNYPASVATSEMNNFMNQPGYSGFGNNGSIHDYFYDASNGGLELTHSEPTAYYRASYYKGFYDSPSVAFPGRAHLLVTEALNNLDAQGCDFSQYDCNGDGLIDGITLLYTGPLVDGGLWPHAGFIDLDFDGVSTYRYVLCPIYSPPVLSVLCHEIGHAVGGFPDLYDYGGDSEGAGVYCLMASDSDYPTDPIQFSAPCRGFAGWCDLVDLTPDMLGQTLIVDAAAGTVFRYPHPTNDWEYYLIENRFRSGRDTHLPDEGLAIWHIDHTGCNDFEQGTPEFHYLTALLQADGRRDLENNINSGDAGDLWSSPVDTECTPLTDPHTNWWSGASSGLYLTQISEPGATMSFVFGPEATPVDSPEISRMRLVAEPNPFNPSTETRWEMAAAGTVELAVYDLQGRLVRTLASEYRPVGPQRAVWNGRDLSGRAVASGVYFVNLTRDGGRESIKIVLAK